METTGGAVLTTGTGLLGVGGWSNVATGTIAVSAPGTNAFTFNLHTIGTIQGTGTIQAAGTAQATGTLLVNASSGLSLATRPDRFELSWGLYDGTIDLGDIGVVTGSVPIASGTLSGLGDSVSFVG